MKTTESGIRKLVRDILAESVRETSVEKRTIDLSTFGPAMVRLISRLGLPTWAEIARMSESDLEKMIILENESALEAISRLLYVIERSAVSMVLGENPALHETRVDLLARKIAQELHFCATMHLTHSSPVEKAVQPLEEIMFSSIEKSVHNALAGRLKDPDLTREEARKIVEDALERLVNVSFYARRNRAVSPESIDFFTDTYRAT